MGIENGHRRFLDRYSIAAELKRERREVSGIEVAGRGVVLHQQRAAVVHVVEQALVVLLHVVAGVVGANAEDDRAEAAEVAALNVICREQGDIQAKLPQHSRDVIARTHDVANLEIGRDRDIRRRWPVAGRADSRRTRRCRAAQPGCSLRCNRDLRS